MSENEIKRSCIRFRYHSKVGAKKDFKFFDKEINLRETTNFPPYATIIRILNTSEQDDKAKSLTHEMFIKLKEIRVKYGKDFYFLEAMKSPVTKIKGKFRYQILLRFNKFNETEILEDVYHVLNNYKSKHVTTFVEINPLSLS